MGDRYLLLTPNARSASEEATRHLPANHSVPFAYQSLEQRSTGMPSALQPMAAPTSHTHSRESRSARSDRPPTRLSASRCLSNFRRENQGAPPICPPLSTSHAFSGPATARIPLLVASLLLSGVPHSKPPRSLNLRPADRGLVGLRPSSRLARFRSQCHPPPPAKGCATALCRVPTSEVGNSGRVSSSHLTCECEQGHCVFFPRGVCLISGQATNCVAHPGTSPTRLPQIGRVLYRNIGHRLGPE